MLLAWNGEKKVEQFQCFFKPKILTFMFKTSSFSCCAVITRIIKNFTVWNDKIISCDLQIKTNLLEIILLISLWGKLIYYKYMTISQSQPLWFLLDNFPLSWTCLMSKHRKMYPSKRFTIHIRKLTDKSQYSLTVRMTSCMKQYVLHRYRLYYNMHLEGI